MTASAQWSRCRRSWMQELKEKRGLLKLIGLEKRRKSWRQSWRQSCQVETVQPSLDAQLDCNNVALMVDLMNPWTQLSFKVQTYMYSSTSISPLPGQVTLQPMDPSLITTVEANSRSLPCSAEVCNPSLLSHTPLTTAGRQPIFTR